MSSNDAKEESPTFNLIAERLSDLNSRLRSIQLRCNTLAGVPNDEGKECDTEKPSGSVTTINDYTTQAMRQAEDILKDLDTLIG